MAIIPTVEDILEKDLFELLRIPNASDEEKQRIIQSMVTTVDARVVGRVVELLSDEEADQFKTIAEAGDPQKLVDFLVEKEIDLPQVVSEEVTRHRIEVVQLLSLAEAS